MHGQRVADIYFPDTHDFGSGYFLTDRLVITAGHVVGRHTRGDKCIVHRYNEVERPLQGSVAWLSSYPDVALIALDRPVPEVDWGDPPVFGYPAISVGAESYECVAIGYPDASVDGGRSVEKVVRGSATEFFKGGFDVTVRDLKPAEVRGWKGLSGAALFSRGLLFAILTKAPTGWEGSLYAVPVRPLLMNPDFRAELARGGMAEPQQQPLAHAEFHSSLLKKIKGQYFLVDRDPQTTALEEAIVVHNAQGFLVEGKAEDRLDFLIERFSGEKCLKQIIGDMKPDQAIASLRWPRAFDVDAPAEFAKLRDQLGGRLNLPLEERTAAEKFAEALQSRAAGIWWRLDLAQAGAGHAELLRLWTAFCLDIQQLGASLYWFLCLHRSARPAQRRAWLPFFSTPRTPDAQVQRVVQALIDRGRIKKFEPLSPILADQDLSPWVERISILNDNERLAIAGLAQRLGPIARPLEEFRMRVERELESLDD